MAISMDELYAKAWQCGLFLSHYNPGDGARYRLHSQGDYDAKGKPIADFHADVATVGTWLTRREVSLYLSGYRAAMGAVRSDRTLGNTAHFNMGPNAVRTVLTERCFEVAPWQQ